MFAGMVIGILVSGPLADRFGPRLFAAGGLGLTAVGLGLVACSPAYDALLIAAAIMGFGAGVLDMILSPIVSALCPERRASAMNMLHAYYCVGAVGTVIAASAGLRFGMPWQAVTLGVGLVPLALTVGFLRVWLPPLAHPDRPPHGLRHLMVRPRFHAALLAIALAGAAEAGMAQWLPAYSERVLGYSKASGGMALAAFSFAMVVGRIGASHGLGRANPYRVTMIAGGACAALYALGSGLAGLPPLALAACVLVGLGCSLLWPTNLGITADRIPEGGATMFGLLSASGNIGCLVVPWIIGLVAEQWGLRVGIFAAACCPALLVFVLMGIRVADRAPLALPATEEAG